MLQNDSKEQKNFLKNHTNQWNYWEKSHFLHSKLVCVSLVTKKKSTVFSNSAPDKYFEANLNLRKLIKRKLLAFVPQNPDFFLVEKHFPNIFTA